MSPKLERQRPEPQSHLVRKPEPIRTGAESAPEAAVEAVTPPVRPARATRKAQARRAAPGPPEPPAEPSPELDEAMLGRWRWTLGAISRKAAATRKRADEAQREWERLVADARSVGVPERLIVAAASDADLPVPEPPKLQSRINERPGTCAGAFGGVSARTPVRTYVPPLTW